MPTLNKTQLEERCDELEGALEEIRDLLDEHRTKEAIDIIDDVLDIEEDDDNPADETD